MPREDVGAGDVVLGLASSGLHSNGFSLVRKLIAAHKLHWQDASPFTPGLTLAEDLLEPTRIYVRSVLAALQQTSGIKALVHVTGGGFQENLPRILPDHCAAEINLSAWRLPPVFAGLQDMGNIEQDELLRTFNCGIGMIVIVSAEHAAAVAQCLDAQGEEVIEIGTIAPRQGEAVVFSGSLEK